MSAECIGGSLMRAGALILLIVASAARADAEGAYAMGQDGGGWAGGGAWNQPDAESARSAALTTCQSDPSAGKSCKIVAAVSGRCFALALSKDEKRSSHMTSLDLPLAKKNVLQACQNGVQGSCTIRAEFCDKLGGSNEPMTPVGAQIPHIFGYAYFDNVVGITILGEIESGDDAIFKRTVLSYLHGGNLVGRVSIYSNGGDVGAATAIGEQIRTLQAETEAPGLEGNIRTCPLDPQMSKVGNRTGGKLGSMRYNAETKDGDPRCRCESSCSLIWAAGVGRYGGSVGVHRFRFEASYYGNLTPQQAKEAYGRKLKELQSYMTGMDVPASITATMLVTSSDDIRYLRKEEITQLDNFPPYMAELKVAKCGTAPGNDEPDGKKETYTSCTKGMSAALYSEGARAYLQKYDSPSGSPSPSPSPGSATPQGAASPCVGMLKQYTDHLKKAADTYGHMATAKEVCTFGRATDIPARRAFLAKANQNGCGANLTKVIGEAVDNAISLTNDACRSAGR